MSKMTDEEVQVLYNKLESRRLRLLEDLEENPTRYDGMPGDVQRWLKNYIGFNNLDSPDLAIQWLFYDIDGHDTKRKAETDIVLEVLRATQDPKLVKIANQYERIRPTFTTTEATPEMAKIIYANNSVGELQAKPANTKDNSSHKATTIGHELQEIKKRTEKLNRLTKMLMRKYEEIRHLDIHKLYTSINTYYSEILGVKLNANTPLYEVRNYALIEQNRLTTLIYSEETIKKILPEQRKHLK